MVAGLAGLLAGSLSMALGEWLSVQSSRELYERQIMIEAERSRRSYGLGRLLGVAFA